jgi:hypothetical protein
MLAPGIFKPFYMKKLLILMILLCTKQALLAQYVYTIKADSVKITNTCDTAELIIENHTQNVPGFLFNKGKGRTEFRRAVQLDEQTIVLGNDTFVILGRPLQASNGLSVQGGHVVLGQSALDSESGEEAMITSNRIIPMGNHFLILKSGAGGSATSLSAEEITTHTQNGDFASLTGTSLVVIGNNTGSLNYANGQMQVIGTAENNAYISLMNDFNGFPLRLQKNANHAFLSNGGLNAALWLFDSGNLIIAGDAEPTDDGAKLQVKGTGTFSDTLTATTMSSADSSNRVATTAFVKNNIASPTLHIITAAASDLTAVAGALTKLPDLTGAGSHSVTLPSAAAHAGERIYLWNRNASGNTWAFASSITLPDGTTTTTIANQTTIELISDGTVWIKWK